MNIETRMILKSLQTNPGLTVGQLVQFWTPTWNFPQVQAMVDELVCDGAVSAQGGSIRRYLATNKQFSGAQHANT